MSDYPMLISNKLHSFRNFITQVFHFVQQNLFPLFLLDIACLDWIEKKSEYTEENKQVAYGKRHEF